MIKILKRIINNKYYDIIAFEISMMIKLIILVFISTDQFQCTLVGNTKMINYYNMLKFNLIWYFNDDDINNNKRFSAWLYQYQMHEIMKSNKY